MIDLLQQDHNPASFNSIHSKKSISSRKDISPIDDKGSFNNNNNNQYSAKSPQVAFNMKEEGSASEFLPYQELKS